jgi:hypothetical protein
MGVSFIGGGNQSTQRKPPTCRKSLTNKLYIVFGYPSYFVQVLKIEKIKVYQAFLMDNVVLSTSRHE